MARIIKWVAIFGLVFFAILLIVKITYAIIDKTFPYFQLFNYSLIIVIVSVLLFVLIINRILVSKNKYSFLDFLNPFFATNRNKHISTALIFWLLVPLIPFLIHFLTPEKLSIEIYVGYFGVWITFLGLLITQRVYFEIKYKPTHSFEEFVNTLDDFIRTSINDDEIYLILPTLFIGANGYPKFNLKFRKKITDLASDNSKKLSIAIFDFNETEIEEIVKLKEDKNIEFGNIDDTENETNETNFLAKIHNSNNLLLKFHLKWNKFNNNPSRKGQFYYDLSRFMKDLNDISKDSSNKFVINKIKTKYFEDNGNPAIGNEGLFLFANISQNVYYLGTIKINAQEDVYFQNSIIEDVKISKEFETIYTTFVAERC